MSNGPKWYLVSDTGNCCSPSVTLRFTKTSPFKYLNGDQFPSISLLLGLHHSYITLSVIIVTCTPRGLPSFYPWNINPLILINLPCPQMPLITNGTLIVINLTDAQIYLCVTQSILRDIMLNPIEKFKVAILHLNRAWNH